MLLSLQKNNICTNLSYSLSKCNTLEITIATLLQDNNTYTHKNTIQYKTMDI